MPFLTENVEISEIFKKCDFDRTSTTQMITQRSVSSKFFATFSVTKIKGFCRCRYGFLVTLTFPPKSELPTNK